MHRVQRRELTITSEAQAAVATAQAAADTARATWALFWVTFSLVTATVAAVIAGWLAAASAIETYRLEAEPVLIVTTQVRQRQRDDDRR
jgi:hypothetical protein